MTTSGEPELRIRLLGAVLVERAGERLDAFDSIRLQRFVARLVLSAGAAESRARIAYELWPDSPEQQARTNLRHLLYDLRRAVPDLDRFVRVTNQTLSWLPDSPAAVDVAQFVDAVAVGDGERAGQWYGGDLLPACYDDWVLAERARLQALAMSTFSALCESRLASGDAAAAVANASRLVDVEPMHEPGCRLLMRALAASGDRTGALRAYHRFADLLAREIGVQPAPETRELYEHLRANETSEEPAPVSARDSPAALNPLLGREHEWRSLADAAAAAMAGRCHVVLVSGEPGIGKTRLVEELVRDVSTEGIAVARTRAYEAAGRLPWAPVAEWLRSAAIRPSLAAAAPVWLAEVARLLPELRGERPDLPPAPALTDAALRHRLFDAVVHVLTASRSPLLLVVDDLQWCDPETIELIGFLLHTAPGAPILVAGTVRDEEIDEHGPLDRLLRQLTRDGAITQIALGRLDLATTTALAAHASGRPIDDGVGARLFDESEGNPLFVVEAVRAGFPAATAMSPTVHAVIAARLAQLSAESRHIAEVAATVGREFSVEVLVLAAGVDPDAAAVALDELWRRHIVAERGTVYDFTHDKLREVTHSRISPGRRRLLHRRVAEALVAVHAGDLGPVSAEVASHFNFAGLTREAIAAWRGAAAQSMEVFALDDAIGHLRRALAGLERLPGGPARDELELELRMELGVPLVARESYGSAAAHECYTRAATLSRRLGRDLSAPLLRALGLDAIMHCRFEETAECGARIIEQAPEDLIAVTEGHYLLGVSAFWRGELAQARSHLGAAVAAYRPELSAVHIARYAQDPKAVCLVRLGLAELWAGEGARAAACVDAALAHARKLEHPTTQGYVLMYGALVAAESGDFAAVARHIAAGDELWAHQELGFFMALGEQFRAWLDVLDGSVSALATMEAVTNIWRRDDQSLHLTYGLVLMARASIATGDSAAATKVIDEALAFTEIHGQRYIEAELWRLDAEAKSLDGDVDGALVSADRALRVASAQGAKLLELRGACTLARLAPGEETRLRLRRVLAPFPAGTALADVRLAAALLGRR